jgi:hypothetical protein
MPGWGHAQARQSLRAPATGRACGDEIGPYAVEKLDNFGEALSELAHISDAHVIGRRLDCDRGVCRTRESGQNVHSATQLALTRPSGVSSAWRVCAPSVAGRVPGTGVLARGQASSCAESRSATSRRDPRTPATTKGPRFSRPDVPSSRFRVHFETQPDRPGSSRMRRGCPS